jgi:hypothetical protein
LLTSEEEIVWVRGFGPAVAVAAEPGARCLTVTVEASSLPD